MRPTVLHHTMLPRRVWQHHGPSTDPICPCCLFFCLQCLQGWGTPSAGLTLPSLLLELAVSYEQRAQSVEDMLREFVFAIPKARAQAPEVWCGTPDTSAVARAAAVTVMVQQVGAPCVVHICMEHSNVLPLYSAIVPAGGHT